mmetsp:Transcript_61776/g.184031  ORF Transcript_61776/g.184031 Transcript_61776/m.184031 type:complete len:210 (-) Transcript_61776:1249-1878(-)
MQRQTRPPNARSQNGDPDFSLNISPRQAMLCKIHSTWYWRMAMSRLFAPPLRRKQPVMNSSMSTSPFWSRSSSVNSVRTWLMSSSKVLRKVSTFSSSSCFSNSSKVRVPLLFASNSSNTRCMLSEKSTLRSISCWTRKSRSFCERCMTVSTKTAVITLRSARMENAMKARKAKPYSQGRGRSARQTSIQSRPPDIAMYRVSTALDSVSK